MMKRTLREILNEEKILNETDLAPFNFNDIAAAGWQAISKHDGPMIVNWLETKENDCIKNDKSEKHEQAGRVIYFNMFLQADEVMRNKEKMNEAKLVVSLLAHESCPFLLSYLMDRYSKLKDFKWYGRVFDAARDCRNKRMATLIYSKIPSNRMTSLI
jgi:hypothetical protein